MLIDELMMFASQSTYDPYNLREALPMALCFQVDNVAHYVYEEGLPETNFHIAQRIPKMAPLAPVMWFEYNGGHFLTQKLSYASFYSYVGGHLS